MKILYILFLNFCFASVSIAQKNVTKLGKIIDDATKLPIPYASIKDTKSKTYTFTNSDGAFKVTLADNYNDSLEISSVGYATLKVAANKMKQDTLVFQMRENRILLNDVNVTPKKAINILKEAVKVSSLSYPDKLILSGYYKEYVKTDSNITKYADGLLNYYVERKNDKDKLPKILLQVLQSRTKSLPVKKEDDDKYNAYNSIIDVGDQVKYINPANIAPLDSLQFDFYNYTYSEVYDNGKSTYVVKFEPKPGEKNALFSGRVFIDVETSLIIRIVYGIASSAMPYVKTFNIFGVKISLATNSMDVQYNIVPYYLTYLNKIGAIKFLGKTMNQTNTFKSEFLATQIQLNNCVPFKSDIYTKRSLYKHGTHYTTEFWNQPQFMMNTSEEEAFIIINK